jgi:hypothetical protein
MRQERIVISKSTTWDRLAHQIASHSGAPVAVVGKGTRARRLILRMFEELPRETTMDIFTNGRDWVAVVNPDGELRWDPPGPIGRYSAPLNPVAWRRDPARFNRAT